MHNVRSIKVKTSLALRGMAQMQFQEAKLGRVGQVVTYEVTGIPKEISDYRVIRQFDLTIFGQELARYSFQFAELGEGKHITQ
jgi:hypothetical protein